MDLKWIPCGNDVSLPAYAVIGGNDVDGDVIYVGRANHNGNMLVAKVIPAKMKAYICWLGAEIAVPHFEVLCSQSCVWKHCYNHQIPGNAVSSGTTTLSQSVYIGRGHYEGSLTVGRISSVHRALFIPFGGAERRLESYDILVMEGGHHYAEEKPHIYPTMPMPMPMPTRTPPPPYLPTAPPYEHFQNPPQNNFIPAGSYRPQPPLPAMGAPVTLYNPNPPRPTNAATSDTWVTASGNYVPHGAVVGGHDSDGSVLYVCRVMHEGFYIPGKAAPNRGCCYICHFGQELIRSNYEILVHSERYHWVPSSANYFPAAAVLGGHARNSEPFYVGRGNYQGALTPGYIQRSQNCLHISYGGHEHRLYNYEYLVHTADFHRGLSY